MIRNFYRWKDLFSSCENFKLLDSARLAQVQHRSSKWQTIFSLDEIDPDQIKISVKGQYLIISSQKKSNIPDMTKVLNQLFYTMTNLPSSPWSKKILIPASVKRSTIRSGLHKQPLVHTVWSIYDFDRWSVLYVNPQKRAKINRKNGINLIVTGKYKDLPLWLFIPINPFQIFLRFENICAAASIFESIFQVFHKIGNFIRIGSNIKCI